MPTMIKNVCERCNKEFERHRKQFYKKNVKRVFCSEQCSQLAQQVRVKLPCAECGKEVERNLAEFKSSKSGNLFCNRSCSASYNNKHKTYGTRRSKAEVFIEVHLEEFFPNLKVIYNSKEAIESELDFYFPDLKLAIELNGIVHYEPIYGQEKFEKIINNDKQKLLACAQKGIEIIIVPNLDNGTKKHKLAVWEKIKEIISNKIN